LRRVRSAQSGAGVNIPAIALTGYASAADRDRALAAGFHAHVTKPVDASHLVHLIAEVTKRA
jgi:two-component system, chemotaxis family, CheB/CheR fusion protein